MNDGGQAFPTQGFKCDDGITYVGASGMTLRDYFAGQALTGLIPTKDFTFESGVRSAYLFADAMLEERLK